MVSRIEVLTLLYRVGKLKFFSNLLTLNFGRRGSGH